MVRTGNDVMDINPLERMEKLKDITEEKKSSLAAKKKELEELEKRKKKEFEEADNKKKKDLDELEAKKRELEDLEKKKSKEIEDTEELIEESFQDLMRHKRMIIKQEEEESKKNLEDRAGNSQANEFKNVSYTKFFENLEEPKRLYDITNKSFYSGLTELRDRAARGEITPQEEEFVERLRDTFDRFSENRDYVQNNDQNEYVRRSIKVIKQIADYTIRHL